MRLTIIRQAGPGASAYTETHEVPEYDGMTVLDALNWIREHEDPSLALRFSCRSDVCKECLAVVDGNRTYTCTVPAVGEITVEPLPNKKLLSDLAVRR
jgi:succinate dehydrogenase/fumarate reductase-like Fe-S protein